MDNSASDTRKQRRKSYGTVTPFDSSQGFTPRRDDLSRDRRTTSKPTPYDVPKILLSRAIKNNQDQDSDANDSRRKTLGSEPHSARRANAGNDNSMTSKRIGGRGDGRGRPLENSWVSGISAASSGIRGHENSRIAPGPDNSGSSAAGEAEGIFTCHNMKMSDIYNERGRSGYYNATEATIVEQRSKARHLHRGKTMSQVKRATTQGGMSGVSISNLFNISTNLRGMTTITDNILLGGRDEAENAEILSEYGVTHILNCAQQLPNYFPQTFVYLKMGLLDSNNASITELHDVVRNFMSHVEAINGRVFVHCLAGVSRSVSVLLMYLMSQHHIPLSDLIRYTRALRPQICPNDAFKLQLAKLEVKELGSSSVVKDNDKMWDFYEWKAIKHTFPVRKRGDVFDDIGLSTTGAGANSSVSGIALMGEDRGKGSNGLSSLPHSGGGLRSRSNSYASDTSFSGLAACCSIS